MAKKPAKRGRPRGSTNKNSDKSLIGQFSKMAFEAQAQTLSTLASMFDSAKKSRAAELMAQLAALGGEPPKKRGRPPKSNGGHVRNGRKGKLAGRSLEAKYRSKKHSSLTWAGRGQTPRWMKEEMKGTKLTREDFAI